MPIVTTADNTQLYVKDEGAPHSLFVIHKNELTQALLDFVKE